MTQRTPEDSEDCVEVVSAVGRYDGFFEVVGVKRSGGRGCWCMGYRDSRVPAPDRGAYMDGQCAAEPGLGVLGYVNGEPAGWCSIAPRSSYRQLMHSRTIPFVDARDAWAAVWFVSRPRFRRRGLMHALLDGAVEHARRHGAQVIEGYPIETNDRERVDVISGYVGTTRVVEQAGFGRAAATTAHSGGRARWVLRNEL